MGTVPARAALRSNRKAVERAIAALAAMIGKPACHRASATNHARDPLDILNPGKIVSL